MQKVLSSRQLVVIACIQTGFYDDASGGGKAAVFLNQTSVSSATCSTVLFLYHVLKFSCLITTNILFYEVAFDIMIFTQLALLLLVPLVSNAQQNSE